MTLATQCILLFLVFAIHLTTCTANLPPGVAGPRWPSFFEAPEFHFNIAKRDIEGYLKPEDDAPGPRWPTVFEAPGFHLDNVKRDAERVLKGDKNAPGPRWPTIFEAPDFHLNIAANDILNATVALRLEHGAAWDVTKFGVMIAPGLLWKPPLNLLGFMGGIGKDTAAAAAHSIVGPVVARSPFALLQSAGAGGYGVAVMDALTRGGVILFEGGKWVAKQFNSTGM
ncbi:hypothetical protein EV127DRAFT_505124 [Xylaria flabelliformis]|nr:hypothetical protein EV127DRAFT_505124 [Xylaria flabelliformis]